MIDRQIDALRRIAESEEAVTSVSNALRVVIRLIERGASKEAIEIAYDQAIAVAELQDRRPVRH